MWGFCSGDCLHGSTAIAILLIVVTVGHAPHTGNALCSLSILASGHKRAVCYQLGTTMTVGNTRVLEVVGAGYRKCDTEIC